MKRTLFQLVWLMLLALAMPLAAMPTLAWAQDDFGDEFADEDADDEPAAEADATVPSSPYDAAVQAIVRSNPTEPADMARAVANLLRFERADLAKKYLDQLTQIPLEPEEQAQLGADVGSDVLTRLINSPELDGAGAEFGAAIQRAWRASLTDPLRLESLADKTTSENPQERYLAIVELRRGGLHGVQPLLAILANESRSDVHRFVREALVRFGSPAADPLVAALETSNPLLKQNVMRVLAQIKKANTARYMYADARVAEDDAVRQTAQKAVQMLEGRVPPIHEAHRELLKMSRDFLKADRRVNVLVDGSAEGWLWDKQRNQLIFQKTHPVVIAALEAERLAREVTKLAPDDAEVQRWHEVCRLQAMKLINGLDKPFPENIPPLAPSADGETDATHWNAVLANALAQGAPAAATAAAELIAQLARADKVNEDLLVQADGRLAPLARALRHADHRVQLAAASAIVATGRTKGFAGAGALIGVLKPLANYSGIRRAVVADPRGARADQLAAQLTGQGLEASGFITGRAMYQAAVASGEHELALITYTIGQPDARRLIEHLRNDARTAQLPIGLIADPDDIFNAETLAGKFGMVHAFVRPRTNEAMQQRIDELLIGSGITYVSPVARTEQARVAISLLDELSRRPSPYDLRDIEPALTNALYHEALAGGAAKALGQLNTHQAQRALVDFASQNSTPLESRKAAVSGFSDSLSRHGVLLTYDEIKVQTIRYDDSDGLERETQDLLWSILDALQTIKKDRTVDPKSTPRRG